MGSRKIGNAAPSLVAALLLGGMLLASVPPAIADSFSGGSMLDLEAERDSFFQEADHDGDFALSTEEQLSAMDKENFGLFECWDDDGDGLCSYSEFLDSGLKVFSDRDADGNGRLTPDEVQ
jgi:hypothetical protein